MFRGFLGFVATLIVVGLLVSVGAGIYQAGITQGVIDAGRFPAGATVPIAGYGYHDGPGIFGLLFGLFFLFILFGIIRAAFFGGRGRGWGHHGYGNGPGWGRGYGPGAGPDGWRGDRENRIADWHRQLHEDEAAGRTNPSGPGGSASSGTSGASTGGAPGGTSAR